MKKMFRFSMRTAVAIMVAAAFCFWWWTPLREPPIMWLPVDFEFTDAPLPHVVEWLGDSNGLYIHLDENAIPHPESIRLSGRANQERFGEAIRKLLAPVGLTCVWRSEVAFVTTIDRADSFPPRAVDFMLHGPTGFVVNPLPLPTLEGRMGGHVMMVVCSQGDPEEVFDSYGPRLENDDAVWEITRSSLLMLDAVFLAAVIGFSIALAKVGKRRKRPS